MCRVSTGTSHTVTAAELGVIATEPAVLWQLYIVVAVEKKLFEVATMIQEGTQSMSATGPVPAGPALRDADGKEHIKSATEGKGGFFPPKVATEGVMVRVQNAQATRDEDQVSILNHIVRSDDPLSQPPREHEEYDKLNRMVRGLFIGAALYTHAMRGNTEKLRELLSDGAEKIDSQSPAGATPASQAAFGGHSDSLRILVQSKANLDVPKKNNATPAFVAAEFGQVDCLRILAQSKANLDIPMKDNTTPAYISAQKGNSDCLLILAQSKANLDVPDNTGVTPLGIAVSKNKADIVQLLVTHGVDVNPPPDNWGDTPLSEAKAKGHSAIVEILLAAGAE